MGKILNYILLFMPSVLFSFDPIHSDVVALGYGSAAAVRGIGALGFNPAGLSDIENAEVLITSNKAFSYNCLGLGYKFSPYGTMGIFLSNTGIGDGLGFSWGRGILPGFAGGLGLTFPRTDSGWDFSARVGVIYAYSHRFIIGSWLQRISEVKTRENLALGGGYRVNSSTILYGGGIISLPDKDLDLSIGMEHSIHKHYKLMGSAGLNSIWVGVSASFPNDRLGFTFGYDLDQKKFQYVLTYTRFLKPFPKPTVVYVSKKTKSSKRRKPSLPRKKKPELTQKIEEKQKKYFDLGIEYYHKEKYQKALTVWQKVVDLYPDNDLALKAQEYIRGVKEMLKKLEEIKKEKE